MKPDLFFQQMHRLHLPSMKRILLFDIDSTLTKTVYHKGKNPLLYALSSVYGTPIEKKNVIFSGGTERSIVRDLLNANDIKYNDTPDEWERIFPLYRTLLAESIANGDMEFQALPNVKELLKKCDENENIELAIVTGNLAHCAELKLNSAGINSNLFKRHHEGENKLIGGFGDDDIYRPGLVAAAMKRFNHLHSSVIPSDRFLVIGDTPKDIHCGHEHKVPGVGVATGIFNVEALGRVADLVLEDFTDEDNVIDFFMKTTLRQTDSLDYNIPADKKEG